MPKNTNSMAIGSAIAGAVGWVAVPMIGSIVAIVLGHMARAEIRKTGEEGDGLAMLGLALGYSHLIMLCLVFAFFIVFYVGLFGFIMTQQPH